MGLYQLAEIRWSGCGPHLVKWNVAKYREVNVDLYSTLRVIHL